jgi:hypothetical protein
MRAKNSGFLTPSFETICSFGSNGAIIHYKPQEGDANNKKIEANNLLLLDSGGHYLDMGTTDVTRTFYLGNKNNISNYQQECFTRYDWFYKMLTLFLYELLNALFSFVLKKGSKRPHTAKLEDFPQWYCVDSLRFIR